MPSVSTRAANFVDSNKNSPPFFRAANAAVTAKYALIPGGLVLAKAEHAINNISAGLGIAASTAATATALGALGKGGGIKGGSIGSEGGASAVQPTQPQFNIVGTSGTNQLAQSLSDQPPIQAYVVSTEMSSQQELDRNRQDTATFG